jgi:hypothetical protein
MPCRVIMKVVGHSMHNHTEGMCKRKKDRSVSVLLCTMQSEVALLCDVELSCVVMI